jgi:S-adenosylmethionine-diacylglycerol 3-amino-3-carboxypropyl transferase
VKEWVRAAAALPVAFAQVREDPRIDLEVCSSLGKAAHVVMIASGGDTAVCLGKLPIRLTLVDMNPAQLALTRCKWQLARGNLDHALQWLGHSPVDRMEMVRQMLDRLELNEDALGPLGLVSELGADYVGRYERVFAALRAQLDPDEVERFLRGDPNQLPLEEAFDEVMSLDNLVALFGAQATQNPVRSFASHFAARTRLAAARFLDSPFLWQVLAGRFPPGVSWEWLHPKHWGAALVTPDFVQGRMFEILERMPACSAELVHLSNILDWLTPEEATGLLRATHRVLKPEGLTLIRQLNSSLNIAGLPGDLEWLDHDFERRDRSFFYPRLHLGRKR